LVPVAVATAPAPEAAVPHETGKILATSTDQTGFVREYLTDRLGKGHPLLAVASCEGKWRQWEEDGTPLKGDINPLDTGVFQVNLKYHGERAKELGIDLGSLQGNTDYALLLYKEQGLTPWNWSKHCWDPQ